MTFGVRRRAMVVSALALGAPQRAPSAEGTGYPNRPIQLVVAAPAGGPSDHLARMLSEQMAVDLGQPWLVLNKPGALGGIAAQMVRRSMPDGHTLMLSWIGNATGPSLVPTLPYDINADFAHITQLVEGTNVLLARADLGIDSCARLFEQIRAHPGRWTYASAGVGSSGHLAMEMLRERARLSIRHVPYRGGMPALLDLLAGRVDIMFVNQDAVLPYAASDRLALLAVAGSKRHPMFPQLPTIAELGFPGFEATAWAGLSAPRGTPREAIARLHRAAVEALHGPMRARQEALGARVVGSSPADYAAFVRAETEKWARVVAQARIRLE